MTRGFKKGGKFRPIRKIASVNDRFGFAFFDAERELNKKNRKPPQFDNDLLEPERNKLVIDFIERHPNVVSTYPNKSVFVKFKR